MSGVSFPQLIQQIKGAIKEITPEEVQERLKAGEPWALLDVREQSEWEEGHLPEAHFIPRGFLEIRTESTLPEKDKPLVVYCAGGVRSAMAAKTLQDMGYTNVVSMSGGFTMILHRADPLVSTLQEHGDPLYLLDENPTAEAIARLIYEEAARQGFPVVEVRLWETPTSWAAYRG